MSEPLRVSTISLSANASYQSWEAEIRSLQKNFRIKLKNILRKAAYIGHAVPVKREPLGATDAPDDSMELHFFVPELAFMHDPAAQVPDIVTS